MQIVKKHISKENFKAMWEGQTKTKKTQYDWYTFTSLGNTATLLPLPLLIFVSACFHHV